MKLKHRCSVFGCWKCGKVDYDKIYFCKKHDPQTYFQKNKKEKSLIYALKNGRAIEVTN